MVPHDVSEKTPSTPLLASLRSASTLFLGAFGCGAARLHVDLCRLASAICPCCPCVRPRTA
ncbi:putative leader peptide [Streptomyces sp. SYSU K21746]